MIYVENNTWIVRGLSSRYKFLTNLSSGVNSIGRRCIPREILTSNEIIKKCKRLHQEAAIFQNSFSPTALHKTKIYQINAKTAFLK